MTGHRVTRRTTGIRSAALAALALFVAFSASAARADRCDDIAKQLAGAVDGLKVNFKAANIIYLTHPAATGIVAGLPRQGILHRALCQDRSQDQTRVLDLVGSAAAVIFTLPKDDTMTGTARCLKRMGILRGDKITMRYRRLDMECTRTKKDTSIVVRRGLDQ